MEVGLGHLHSNVEHPDIIEGQLAIVATEDVELSFYYIGSVAAARSWPILTCLHLLPVTLINIEYVHVIHPMCAIIASKVVNL